MMPKTIKFIFKEDGSVETEAFGFQGKECTKLTDALMEGISGTVQKRKLKKEYHVEKQTNHVRLHTK